MAFYKAGLLRLDDVDKRTHAGLIAAFDRAERMYILARAGSPEEKSALIIMKRIEGDVGRLTHPPVDVSSVLSVEDQFIDDHIGQSLDDLIDPW